MEEKIKNPENNHISKVTFQNKPKLSEHEVDSKFNERRLNLVSGVELFLSSHPKFKDEEISVEFAQRGISSLVCILKMHDEKLVLKIPLSPDQAREETLFLETWESVGVSVPHIKEEGSINEHSYALMEYIDAPILSNAYSNEELITKKLYFEMGRVLCAMHAPTANGFGRVVDGKAEYAEFKDWILGSDIQKKFQYIIEYKLFDDENFMNTVRNILVEFTKSNSNSSYCHGDFGTHNIFATEPITVFDPNPHFNNGYIDLGRSIQYLIGKGVSYEQLVDGYFNGGNYDKRALLASIFLNIYMKLPYAHKTKQVDRIANLRKYLYENEHLLK